MTTTIERVRHRVHPGVEHWGGAPFGERTLVLRRTVCDRPFVGLGVSTRDTRHHEPARSRCPECWA